MISWQQMSTIKYTSPERYAIYLTLLLMGGSVSAHLDFDPLYYIEAFAQYGHNQKNSDFLGLPVIFRLFWGVSAKF